MSKYEFLQLQSLLSDKSGTTKKIIVDTRYSFLKNSPRLDMAEVEAQA